MVVVGTTKFNLSESSDVDELIAMRDDISVIRGF